jgi:small subunit ribosomal protein S18
LKSQSIDSSALAYTRVSTTSALSVEAGLNLAVGGDSMGGPASSRASEPGIAVDYCIFCYHGLSHLRHDNTTLLSKFVSERGAILPKRFTKCCAKHQKVVAATLKRARSLALIPFHAKLHPQARFPSFSPPHPTTRGTLSLLQATQLSAAASESSLGGKGGGLGVAKQMLIEELSK